MKKTILMLAVLMVLMVISSVVWAGGNKEKQDDFTGMYVGVIPAADCPGIVVLAILNAEGKYKVTYQYIDRDVAVLTFTGAFAYDGNTKTITLDGNNLPPYYRVGKQSLIQLDMEGKEIKSNFAGMYILRKV